MSGKRTLKRSSFAPTKRIRSLQIDVVADQHKRALLIIQIDPACRVGQDDGANAHAPEHAHGKRDLLRRISFIKMHAALHHGHGNKARRADHQLSSMPDRSRPRETREFRCKECAPRRQENRQTRRGRDPTPDQSVDAE